METKFIARGKLNLNSCRYVGIEDNLYSFVFDREFNAELVNGLESFLHKKAFGSAKKNVATLTEDDLKIFSSLSIDGDDEIKEIEPSINPPYISKGKFCTLKCKVDQKYSTFLIPEYEYNLKCSCTLYKQTDTNLSNLSTRYQYFVKVDHITKKK
jgi:hypothetical protein